MARPRSEDKRQAILLAATRLFAEEGLNQAVQKPRRPPREPSFETRTESQTYCLS
jgi:hypothetical protein